MFLLLALLALATTIAAAPSISLPINSQVPPVARTSQTFNFVFSTSTFTSTEPTIKYYLSGAPEWLHLNGPSRTLSGTPGAGDVGSVTFDLVAMDSTGSTSMSVTLVVSGARGPVLGASVSKQLSSLSGFSSPDTLFLYPSSILLIEFPPSTFTGTDENTVYYALCANNTPLPSWINFDSGSLSFEGTTPGATSPVQLPQTYEIQLTASDVVGFAGAILEFQLIVGIHELVFSGSHSMINVTQGTFFNYTGLQNGLALDGKPVQASDLAQATADFPSWISFDPKTLVLSGTPPTSASSENISITATDVYGDTANTTVLVQVDSTSKLFQGTLGSVNATIGSVFNYTISPTLFGSSSVQISVDFDNTSSWLTFDSQKWVIQGQVPSNLEPQQDSLNITATQGSQSQSQTLTINVVPMNVLPKSHTTSSQSLTTRATSTSSSTPKPPSSAAGSSGKHTSSKKVAIAATVPLLIMLGTLLVLYCYLRRKRQRKAREAHRPSKEKISRPIITEEPSYAEPEIETTGHVEYAHKRTSSKAPRLELPGLKRNSQNRWSRRTTDEDGLPKRESWGDYVRRQSSSRRVDSSPPRSAALPKFEIAPGERDPVPLDSIHSHSRQNPSASSRPFAIATGSPSKLYSRQTKRLSNMSFASSALLADPRVSGVGVGHGKGGFGTKSSFGPPGHGLVRDSWRNTSTRSWTTTDYTSSTTNGSSSHQRLSSAGEQNHSSINPTLRSFPRPPTNSIFDPSAPAIIHEASDDEPRSIRVVTSPSQEHLKRQVYFKRRARNRHTGNPLFSAGAISRRSSSHRSASAWLQSIRGPTTAVPALDPLYSDEAYQAGNDDSPPRRQPQRKHRSYSQSSSVDPPLKPSPRKKKAGPPTRTSETLGRLSRFQSRSSLASSRRFESAASDLSAAAALDDLAHADPGFLGEGVDEMELM
ncbi:Immunoglobulin-like fold [Lasallia pustulata]|uniref:Immunoglobulin-like fold n=1 Tax=Lasallia pustulata TaxID=136370 RepID=A0A1W5DCK5_9LECA|nr:Immunoglobulin-like fold [Lasallia pustulata]